MSDRFKALKSLAKPAVIRPIRRVSDLSAPQPSTPPLPSAAPTPTYSLLVGSSDQEKIKTEGAKEICDPTPVGSGRIRSDRLDLPLRTANPLNGSQGNHWRAAQRRVDERDEVGWAWKQKGWQHRAWRFPVEVTLIRSGTHRMDEDGCIASLKSVRDAVAFWLGVDDGDRTKVRFVYELPKRGPYRVTVIIREVTP